MAERSVDFLLIGGGVAAGSCARALRRHGADGDVLIVGREPDPPYNRPPLSKDYLRGESSKEKVLIRPERWYEENGVDLLTMTSVTNLDPGERVATLSNKDRVRFDKALLATGANVRILRVDGCQLDGIHYLRTLRNSDALREEAEKAERIALIGGSYIGTELAASFTTMGKQCELIMLEKTTLERFYGREVGAFCQRILTDHGVKVHGGQELERFEGSGDRVERVVTKSGLEIDCDFVVVGAGVQPDVRLAEQAGLDVDSGVLTDRYLETSAPGIFAAGDIAQYDSVVHDRRLRIEHWDVAHNHGKVAAANMLGGKQVYDVVPYFWSDLAKWGTMMYVGPASDWDEIWWRGSPDEGAFTAWYVKDGRLAGAFSVRRAEDLTIARQLIADKTEIAGMRAQIEDVDSELTA